MKFYMVQEWIQVNDKVESGVTGIYSSYEEAIIAIKNFLLEYYEPDELNTLFTYDPYDKDETIFNAICAESEDFYKSEFDIRITEVNEPLK